MLSTGLGNPELFWVILLSVFPLLIDNNKTLIPRMLFPNYISFHEKFIYNCHISMIKDYAKLVSWFSQQEKSIFYYYFINLKRVTFFSNKIVWKNIKGVFRILNLEFQM